MILNLETINTGQTANDGNGDPLRTAFSKSQYNDSLLKQGVNDLSGHAASEINNLSGYTNYQLNDLSGYIDSRINNLNSIIISSGNYLEQQIKSTGETLYLFFEELSGVVAEIQNNIT